MWSDADNGGRGGWVIPGLSEKMGGPKGNKAGHLNDADVANAKGAAPTLANANEDFLRGGYLDANEKMDQLVKADPKAKDDPAFKKLRKHLDIELNM